MIAPSVFSQTPVSNTGLIPQKGFVSSVDTMTLVLRKVWTASAAIAIKELIERAFSEQIEFDASRSTFMMRQWDGCSSSSLRGVMLHWLSPKDNEAGTLRVHLPGKAIAAAGQRELYDCVQVLWSLYGGDCTRLDVAADDYAKITRLDDLKEAQRKRNYTGVRSHRWSGSGSLNDADSLTYYFGSKSSDSQLRVYDKAKESKGKTDCIRWELQVRRVKAKELANIWLGGGQRGFETMAKVVTGAICGAVDFIDRSKRHKDLTRCTRLRWWSHVRSNMGEAFKVAPKKKEPLLKEKIGWICEAVMPSLAAVKSYLGDQDFWTLMDTEISDRSKDLSSRNRKLVTQAKADDADIAKCTPWSRSRLKDFISAQQVLQFGPI